MKSAHEPVVPADLKQLKAVFDAVDAAMMIIDVGRDGRLRYGMLNAAAEVYFGISHSAYADKEVLPYRGADGARRRRREQTIAAYREAVATRMSVTLELQHVRPGNELRWGRHTVVPIHDGKRVRQLMVTSIDVTDLVATRERLENALARSLSEFVTICATCKSIRSDSEWLSIEAYAAHKLNYEGFSHGLCPACAATALADLRATTREPPR